MSPNQAVLFHKSKQLDEFFFKVEHLLLKSFVYHFVYVTIWHAFVSDPIVDLGSDLL